MKKWIVGLLALALLATPALAAEPTRQSVEVGGKPVEFSMYTLYDENGYATNYVKLRDVAWALQFTSKRFNVSYDGSTVVTTGAQYVLVGNEMSLLEAVGSVKTYTAVLTVDGVGVQKEALLITPPGSSDGNFYYKLRDLGDAIGFGVGWSAERGVYLETEG